MKAVIIALLAMGLTGCASRSVLPDVEELKVSREKPSKDCKGLGPVKGQTMSAKEGPKEALEDMKKEATMKGANYLQVKQYSSQGTSVTGLAFECS